MKNSKIVEHVDWYFLTSLYQKNTSLEQFQKTWLSQKENTIYIQDFEYGDHHLIIGQPFPKSEGEKKKRIMNLYSF